MNEVSEDCVMFISTSRSDECELIDGDFQHISPRFRPRAFDLICAKVSLLPMNIILATLAVVSLVGQNVILPLWIDSSKSFRDHDNLSLTLQDQSNNLLSANESHRSLYYHQNKFKTDSFFIVAVTSVTLSATFGTILLIAYFCFPNYKYIGETEKKFPQKYMLGIGVCGGTTSILLVYSSSGERTAPYLQAILSNFMIPMTLALRFFLLHKLPTRRKFYSSMAVVLALFICLTPTIFPQIDPNGSSDLGGEQVGLGHIMWPLCFMLGFVPVAFINVVEEKALKLEDEGSSRQVNLFYFLFCCSIYEVITITVLFWTDLIPGFGNADGFSNFLDQWSYNLTCFLGSDTCASTSSVLGTLFLLVVLTANLSVSFLLRYSEGALLVAIVCALVTPLSFLFWTLFQEVPFLWNPRVHITTWFSIGSLFLMCPGIYLYNTGESEQTGLSESEVVQLQDGFGTYEDLNPIVIEQDASDGNQADILTTNV